MKEFRKTPEGLFICEECGRINKNILNLVQHIRHYHKMTRIEYFDKWLKEDNDDICKYCGKTTKFNRITSGYHDYCCTKCMANSKEIQEKRIETSILLYGTKYPCQSEIIKKVIKKSNLKLYNEEFFFKSNEFKEKSEKTCIEKYDTNLFVKSKNFKEKRKQTFLNNYGVDHNFKIPEVKEKRKQTWLKNYGVSSPSQNLEIYQKQQEKAHAAKHYLNTNIYYRGSYELDFLEKHHHLFSDMINAKSIKYLFENKEHWYHPDFFIPSLNLVVEIKNSYLFKRDFLQIQAKEKATIASGFKYIIIVDKDYTEFKKLY